MQGPWEVKGDFALGGSDQELLWLTGYEATVSDEDGEQRLGQEFICHASLFLDGSVEDYRRMLGTRAYGSRHIFTLAQGESRIQFPEGFAIPFPARQRVQLRTQALNLNPEHVGKAVRHHIRAEFLHDDELWRRPKPLFMLKGSGGVLVPPGQAGESQGKLAHGATLPINGMVWSGHWIVPPGPHVNTTDVTDDMSVPFDTTIHYITSHLHPYAQWQELRDKTTGAVVHRVEVKPSRDGQLLAEIPPYSSATGLRLQAGHRYELVTSYNNTSGHPITAMSIMFCYCLDKEFRGFEPDARPASAPLVNPNQGLESDELCAPTTLKSGN